MAGVCRLGDKSKALICMHGCPACPHPEVEGPAITGSFNVMVGGLPALRVCDLGIHTACCGPNKWIIMRASAQVFVNGQQLVRKGDPTLHCGGPGKMKEASGNVHDGSADEPNPLVKSLAIDLLTHGLDLLGDVAKYGGDAKNVAMAFELSSLVTGAGFEIAPDLIKGDTHDALRDAFTLAAEAGVGAAVGSVCEVGSLSLGSAACLVAGVAASKGAGFLAKKAYDPIVHTVSKHPELLTLLPPFAPLAPLAPILEVPTKTIHIGPVPVPVPKPPWQW